jgi:hypothetical protein
MSEPKSWLEEGAPQDIERLVRAARQELPDERAPGRILTALGVGLGAASITGGAGAASTAAAANGAALITGSSLLKWGALGVTLGTLAVGAVTVARDGLLSAPTRSTQPVEPRPSASRPAPLSAEQHTTEPTPRASVAEAVKPRSERGRSPDAAPASVLPLDAETLAEEVKSVDRARAALAKGRAAETLAALDDYDRRFQDRRFAPEALYLRMEALESLGRTAEARATAEHLVARYPKSPQAARAEAVLAKNP